MSFAALAAATGVLNPLRIHLLLTAGQPSNIRGASTSVGEITIRLGSVVEGSSVALVSP